MKVLSLFSGIGAFEKALTNLGIAYETVGFSEIDKYAIKSYCAIHNVNESLNLGDITKIDLEQLPKCDLITHGSPCQDFSIAGNQAGGDIGTNTRSSLMWNSVEIIRRCRPKFVIWENVKNVLSKKHRHNFDKYIDSLEEIGYTSYYQVLNAKNYGIPQNRERIFCISIRKDIDNKGFEFPIGFDNGIRLKDLLEDEVDEKFYISSEKVEKLLMQLKDNHYINKNTIYEPFENCVSYPLTSQDFVRTGVNENCPTLSARDYKDPKCEGTKMCVLVKQATKEGYIPCEIGGVFEGSFPNSNTRRGRVQDGGNTCPTIQCSNEILRVEENKVIQVGNIVDTGNWDNPQRGRIYSTDGCSPSLNTVGGGGLEPKIVCEQRCYNKRVIQRVDIPQTVTVRKYNVDIENLKTLLRSKKSLSNKELAKRLNKPITLVEHWFRKDNCFSIPDADIWLQLKELLGIETTIFDKSIMEFEERIGTYEKAERCYLPTGIAPTLTSTSADEKVIHNYRIRKLTPKECFRLMGFDDEDFQKCIDIGISNSQLYKQAGNSIVVDVLCEIFKKLLTQLN